MSKIPRDPATVRDSLELIASALKQPVAALFDEGGSALRETETLVLVRAFESITDRPARARCVAFIEAEAERATRA